MRLWTLHPKYLDRQGLLALWREALQAQAILQGKAKGYRNHPQLERFRNQPDSVAAIASYLKEIHLESKRRGFRSSELSPVVRGTGRGEQVMGILDRIEKKEIRDLLGKGWLTHDFMWFYNTYQELGMEKANTLNKATIKSHAPIEMQRAKKVLGLNKEKIDTFHELMDFLLEALELILPESVFKKSHFSAPSKNLIHWEWENGECFAHKGMKQIGLIDEYSCGVMYRIECWLEALGISYNIDPKIDRCIMHERGECSGDIKVFLDQ